MGGEVKTIRISDDDLHARFKAECARRRISVKDATERAIREQMARWEQEEQESQDG